MKFSLKFQNKQMPKQTNRTFIPLIGGFHFDSLTLLFWVDLFLEARAEVLEKNWWFLGKFEINWPLGLAQKHIWNIIGQIVFTNYDFLPRGAIDLPPAPRLRRPCTLHTRFACTKLQSDLKFQSDSKYIHKMLFL